jgi:hypothetical protein
MLTGSEAADSSGSSRSSFDCGSDVGVIAYMLVSAVLCMIEGVGKAARAGLLPSLPPAKPALWSGCGAPDVLAIQADADYR